MQKLFESDDAAYKEVVAGNAWAAIVFQQNYSDSLVERTEAGRYADDFTLDSSVVDIRMDMSSKLSPIN